MTDITSMDDDATMTVVFPAVSDDAVARGLVELCEATAKATGQDAAHGLLGGEWGYGIDYKNAVFMMKPFCWCEQDDCAWCAGCSCGDDAYQYFVDGVEVGVETWNAEHDADMEQMLEDPAGWRDKRASRVDHLTTKPIAEKLCAYCRGEQVAAPNFEHRASGTKVWWYKYIGRSMEVNINQAWPDVLAECFASLPQIIDVDAVESDVVEAPAREGLSDHGRQQAIAAALESDRVWPAIKLADGNHDVESGNSER